MHEVQIEKLRWLLKDLGIEVGFTKSVSLGWSAEDEADIIEEVDGIFLSYTEADRLIELLRSVPVAA